MPSQAPTIRSWVSLVWSRLRSLSAHRLSVWLLLAASAGLFGTVIIVALPSARIRVWPRVTLVSHTANVLLVVSGSTIPVNRQHVLPLLPLTASIQRSLTFDEISKNFLGENAEVTMTIINESKESYDLRGGTRLVNQAGMIFRTLSPITAPPASLTGPGFVSVRARAEPKDLYYEIVGERGNVPPGLKWEFPGLSLEDRKVLYARNLEAATGGATVYGTLLREEDLELAKRQLEQELLRAAKARIEEEVEALQAATGHNTVVLQYDVLTRASFSGVVLPMHLVGTSVTSLPVEGGLRYTVLAYDKDALLGFLLPGLADHVEDGYDLIEGSVQRESISVNVIEYDDNLQWVKITAELTGKQRAALSAASIGGRAFGEKVREAIRGTTVNDAERIIQNFTEVDHVEVSVWPPWRRSLPSLPSNIVILPQVEP
ncbi:MAG: hypothetical protein AAB853_00120 [Patescibacteria group bacterium]